MVKARKFVKVAEFVGEPKISDFKLVEEELPELKDGDILVEAEWLSVDPYMRVFAVPPGTDMIGGQVAKILETKNPQFRAGTFIFASIGWRTRTVFNPDTLEDARTVLLPDFGGHHRSLAVGTLGMPGNTAYFGLLEICKPRKGETLVVSGAAGAVGSLVGQIGKIKGLRVIGIAGSDEKAKWLVDELGFDAVMNYKTTNVEDELKKVVPKGVDCYFDNVGGEISSTVLYQMNPRGRISVCGSISGYNDDPKRRIKATIVQPAVNWGQLKMEGFMVYQWWDKWMDGIKQMLNWIQEGKIKYQETITEGFENMPKAFIELLQGKTTGKAVVKV